VCRPPGPPSQDRSACKQALSTKERPRDTTPRVPRRLAPNFAASCHHRLRFADRCRPREGRFGAPNASFDHLNRPHRELAVDLAPDLSVGLRNRRRLEVRIHSGALPDSADHELLQGLRPWRPRLGYVPRKLVSDSGRVSGEYLASSRSPARSMLLAPARVGSDGGRSAASRVQVEHKRSSPTTLV